MKLFKKNLLKFIKTNKTAIVAVIVTAFLLVPTMLYLGERKNSQTVAQKVDQQTTSVEEKAVTPTEVNKTTDQSTTTSTSQNTVATTKNSTAAAAAPTPTTPKAPYSFSFSSGNRTATWYTGGTFSPGNGYTDEWVSFTSKADANGFLNWRFSYNCSSGSACPSIMIQGSNDGSSWINYKVINNSSGTITYPVLYTYYRLFLNSGSCSSNACPPPTPPFPITYELSASGYYYYQ